MSNRSPQDAPRRKIVLAEDDPDQRGLMEMLLGAQDYDVVAVSDGREAWNQLNKDRPDLLITDLMMPNMDGLELVRMIKSDPALKALPILVLTVLDDAEKEFELLNLGVDDYCEKNMQKKIILKRVENLLSRLA